MFDNDLLDKLSRVHPAVPPVAVRAGHHACSWSRAWCTAPGWLTLAWLLGGYLFWTLTEYWLHRIVFHFEPEAGIGKRGCTGSSTASTTTIPTTRCAW